MKKEKKQVLFGVVILLVVALLSNYLFSQLSFYPLIVISCTLLPIGLSLSINRPKLSNNIKYYFAILLRSIGLAIILLFSIILYFGPLNEGKDKIAVSFKHPLFTHIIICLITGIIIFCFAEILIYLNKIFSTKIEDKETNIEDKEMTCPRCYGKGFVDLNDIKRLGKEKEWGQGYCRYCDGKGEVFKGKTKIVNPLSSIGPELHNSDIVENSTNLKDLDEDFYTEEESDKLLKLANEIAKKMGRKLD